jgi:transcriptional regulator with XRE-family HTH domain
MPTLINKRIALNFRNGRLMRNYSQEYMASEMHISQNAYSKMEMGKTRITVESVFKVAAVLELDIYTLMDIKQQYVVA